MKKAETTSKHRKPVSRAVLEETLTEAVKSSHPEFESFAGVIVERAAPSSPELSNWVVKGVRYGKADRHRSGNVLAHCVDQAREEYELSDPDESSAA